MHERLLKLLRRRHAIIAGLRFPASRRQGFPELPLTARRRRVFLSHQAHQRTPILVLGRSYQIAASPAGAVLANVGGHSLVSV
jgi:hypothetical protein